MNQKSIEERPPPASPLTRVDEDSDNGSNSSNDDIKILCDSPSPLQRSISKYIYILYNVMLLLHEMGWGTYIVNWIEGGRLMHGTA